MNTIIDSSVSSGYKVNIHTLDEVYKDQLLTLRKLFVSQNNATNMKIWKRWLGVFGKASDSEKLARNCLCALMQQQLQELGYLEVPFTDLQNCNRDLEKVLQTIDSTTANSVETRSGDYRNNITFDSHCREAKCPFDRVYEEHFSKNLCDHKSHIFRANEVAEYESNSTHAKKDELRHELELLRMELATQHMENMNLKETNEQQKNQLKTANDKLINFKMNMLEGLESSLSKISATEDRKLPAEFLQNVFNSILFDQNNQNNEEILKKLRDIDVIFQMNLQRYIQKKKDNTEDINVKLLKKTKDKYKEKYRRRVHFTSWVQRLQIKLIRLKLFSSLREICIKYKSVTGSESIWRMLEELENRYQSVINEIL